MDLNPITRVILQHAAGYYSVAFDATAGLVILPGTGVGAVVHNGTLHSFAAADVAATTASATPDAAMIAAALLSPVVTAHPGDDLSTLTNQSALINLAPGDYTGFHVA